MANFSRFRATELDQLLWQSQQIGYEQTVQNVSCLNVNLMSGKKCSFNS
jgi:hypothetical protein